MNKIIEILIGLVLLLIPIYVWIINLWGFGDAALVFLQGGIMWLIMLIGAVFLIMGISELK